MTARVPLPAAVMLAAVGLMLSVGSAHAQSQPQSPIGGFGPIADPLQWATRLFNDALVGLGRSTSGEMVEKLDWLMGRGNNIVNSTPGELSYDNPNVRRLWGVVRGAANAGLAVALVLGGFNLIVHPHIRAPYHGALELLPRLAVGGILVNTSLDWGRFAIDMNNALCKGVGSASIPAWTTVQSSTAGATLLNLLAIGIYVLMGMLLFGQMVMRLALIDALLIVAPIALLCWVLPQTQGWARLWFTTFFGTVFVQFLQVVVLQLGTMLMETVAGQVPNAVTNPATNGQQWIMTLLFSIAVLQLTRKVPNLMPGYPSGAVDPVGALRAIATRQFGMALFGSTVGGRKR